MADINQTDVKLNVNNQEAKQSLDEVKKKLAELEAAWVKTASTGDKQMRDKLNKQIQATKRELRQMESGAKACERVFQQLNKAAPNDLRKALNHLQGELKNVERGSDAWKSHTEKIRILRAELAKVNSELQQSESVFTRMKNTVNNWGASIAAGAAALTGVVAAGKAAVNAYAEMEQEEANVRKYTGMTAEQVANLNEEFRKMDTRTSREELNKLAQEAGRLGMQSEEDVLGFVRAADKINVALDDLGDGATLTLSKLTDIFGDKQALGTERSLLAVGSVINELSQNSTAAAPYLAEFAQRIAGVGAQAHMTIPEIMGFGAVLDSQGQKLEMSSTALSKVIMNLFKDPAKIAQATGLSIEQFSETCKRSTNEGLLMLLDRLHELGGIDALAPVCADMGENGARASAVLAALAGNVDMVRQQQEAANIAFEEANSIDKEFEVQNTTVMAGLEKRKKIFQEHAIELGQKLLPVMGYFHSSMSYTMKALSLTIDWVIKYKNALIVGAAAITAYYVAMKAQDAWNAVVNGAKQAIAAVKKFNATLLANPYAAIAALIVGIGVALGMYIKKQREAAKAADENRKALERQQEAEKRIASSVGEVVSKYEALRQEWKRLSSEQEKKAWLEKNKEAFEQLGLNINSVIDADDAFVKNTDKVIAALKARAKAEALNGLYQEKLTEAYEKATQESQEKWSTSVKSGQWFGRSDTKDSFGSGSELAEGAGLGEGDFKKAAYSHRAGGDEYNYYLTEQGAQKVNEYYAKKAAEDAEALTKQYTADVDKIYGDMYAAAVQEANAAEANTGGLVGAGKGGSNTGGTVITGEGGLTPEELKAQHDAALKDIEEWKKKENAINQIAYLQGKNDFKTYSEENKKIEVEYWQKRMGIENKGSAEYLDAEAKMLEAQRKQEEYATGQTVEAEQKRYSETRRILDQRYADGEMTARAYQLATEQAELEHLQNMVNLYKEGSDERIKAQEKYNQRSLAIQQKHAQEAQKMQENLRNEYFKSVSGNSNPEGMAEEKAQLEIVRAQLLAAATTAEQKLEIEEAYQKARYEIAKKYNDEAEMMAVNSAQASIDQVLEYMKSDGFQGFYQSFQTLVSGMGEIFSGLSSLIDAETDIQTAKIEQKYAAELAAAEGNSDAMAAVEAKKEKEIAAVKNEAEEKKYGMQIASTIAQTAISAVNAYSSAAAIPVVGFVMAPIAAAMAAAAGGIQLATLKKQHEAAMAQGYAAGGYTMPGGKYQPAGIVHAGEWVASQELLANPTAAATIAQLDQAQRTNTIGMLDRKQVSASVSAPVAAAQVTRVEHAPADRSSEAIDRLNKTLDNGIYAATTLTGDKGILRAQKRYDQLMRNKGKK